MDGASTQLVYIPDQGAVAVSQTQFQFRDKTNYIAVIQALCSGVQTVEDNLFALLVDGTIDNAAGDALDQWGTLVGQPRGGLVDYDYRNFIKAKLLVNRCNGTTDALITIWATITPPSRYIVVTPFYPKTMLFEAVRSHDLTDAEISAIDRTMQGARPAGVAFTLVQAPVGYFGFDDDPDSFGFDDGFFSETI